ALAHAHEQGIIHRDIKPENIVLERVTGIDELVRVLDFGLAKIRDGQTAMTVGMALGTPNYMAPEQIGEGTVDQRTDLYAAGVILFEMLTGRRPFDGPEIGEILRQHLHEPLPSLRALAPDAGLSPALEAVVERAMAK